jgi:hypothetical protein
MRILRGARNDGYEGAAPGAGHAEPLPRVTPWHDPRRTTRKIRPTLNRKTIFSSGPRRPEAPNHRETPGHSASVRFGHKYTPNEPRAVTTDLTD